MSNIYKAGAPTQEKGQAGWFNELSTLMAKEASQREGGTQKKQCFGGREEEDGREKACRGEEQEEQDEQQQQGEHEENEVRYDLEEEKDEKTIYLEGEGRGE